MFSTTNLSFQSLRECLDNNLISKDKALDLVEK